MDCHVHHFRAGGSANLTVWKLLQKISSTFGKDNLHFSNPVLFCSFSNWVNLIISTIFFFQTDGTMNVFIKRALRAEGPQLSQKSILVKKSVRESLGMRIGGGIGSNEGDTPIYVANIHPSGCVGKLKQLKVN